MEKPTESDGSDVPIWKEMTVAIYWLSVIWLCLLMAVILSLMVQWATSKDPARYELAIVSGFSVFWSIPAGLGVSVGVLAPRTGLTLHKRLIGIALVLSCIGAELLFDYLQARYR